MTFTAPWVNLPELGGGAIRVPVLDVVMRGGNGGAIREKFVVDSGADISMAPRRLSDLLGIAWDTGTVIELQGISPREECKVLAAIHPVEILVREAACRFTIPFCFAEGNAPALLGREGFFDAFRICFDKENFLTSFELRGS